MVARSSLLRRPTPGARPARRTSSVVAALAALAPRLVRFAHHGYPARLLSRGSAAQQPLEQRVRLGDEDAQLARVALVVAARQAARLLLVPRDVDDERHRLGSVRLERARGRVIGHDQQAPLAARGPQPLEQRADHLLVHVLDRLDLLLRVAHVAALVGRLDVQEEELALLEGAQPVLGLAAEVRVEETGGARHGDLLEPRQHAEAVHQVDGGDDRALDAEALAQRRQPRALALPPGPDRGRRALAARRARLAEGMPGPEAPRAFHQVAEHLGPGAVGEVPRHRLAGAVVRRRGAHAALAAAPHEEVAVADAGVELEAVAAERAIHVADDLRRLLARRVAGREVAHDLRAALGRLERHQVAAERDVVGAE